MSRTMGALMEKSFEVAAAMLINPACAAVGLVNFVTVKVMMVAILKVPAVSFTVNTELANATVHVAPEEGAVTAQTLGVPEVSRAMPKPDSVILIPASLPAVIAVAGVKEKVAVVATAFCGLARVIASPLMAPACAVPTWCMKSRQGIRAHSLYIMMRRET